MLPYVGYMLTLLASLDQFLADAHFSVQRSNFGIVSFFVHSHHHPLLPIPLAVFLSQPSVSFAPHCSLYLFPHRFYPLARHRTNRPPREIAATDAVLECLASVWLAIKRSEACRSLSRALNFSRCHGGRRLLNYTWYRMALADKYRGIDSDRLDGCAQSGNGERNWLAR